MPERKNELFIWMPIVVALFLLAAIALFQWNTRLFYSINATSSMLGGMWAHITVFGDGLVVAVLLIPFLRKRPDILWAMLWTVIVFNIILHSLKSGLDVPRPPFVLPGDGFFIIGPAYSRHSFPSGHTATAFAYAGVLAFALRNKWMRAGLFTAALLVGLSRIGVGVHWPADVCAGLIVGWGGAWIGWKIADRISIGTGLLFQLIFGALLIAAAAVLLFDYHTKYPQADWLRYAVGGVMLVWGIVDYTRIIVQAKRRQQ